LRKPAAAKASTSAWPRLRGRPRARAGAQLKPAFKRGLWLGLAELRRGKRSRRQTPWTLKNSADWSRLYKLDDIISPQRHWVERTLPPRDRVSFVFSPQCPTTRASRCI